MLAACTGAEEASCAWLGGGCSDWRETGEANCCVGCTGAKEAIGWVVAAVTGGRQEKQTAVLAVLEQRRQLAGWWLQ